jgi:hypothetical protein
MVTLSPSFTNRNLLLFRESEIWALSFCLAASTGRGGSLFLRKLEDQCSGEGVVKVAWRGRSG